MKNISYICTKISNQLLGFCLLFMLTLFLNSNVYGQINLVPNPSFEEYTDCPVGWASFGVQNWFSINGSPDYYNSCGNDGSCDGAFVPCNMTGYQYAKEGIGYVGVLTYVTSYAEQREFVGVELVTPLEQGRRYYTSMYVSLSSLVYNEQALISCAANNMGFRFTNVLQDNGSGAYIKFADNIAQVYCDSVISDTLNWTRVSGSFIADSAYRYLIIGNHFDDAHTTVSCTDTQWHASAYYYVDVVSVSTDSIVGINDIAINTECFEIYPNPTSNTIYLKRQSRKAIDYTITDVMGKIMKNENNHYSNQIDVKDLTNGIYFITVNKNQTKKFLIVH